MSECKNFDELSVESEEAADYKYGIQKVVENTFSMIIYCNLSKNYYKIISYENFPVKQVEKKDSFDNLILTGTSLIPKGEYQDIFYKTFNRQSLLSIYESGQRFVKLEYPQISDNGDLHWIESQVIFLNSDKSTVHEITLLRCIDKEKLSQENSEKTKAFMGILANEYSSVYYVNLDKNEIKPFVFTERIDEKIGDNLRQNISYTEAYHTYAQKCTNTKDRDSFLSYCSISYIKKQLANKERFIRIYRNEANKYCEMKCVKIGDWKSEKSVVLGFAVKDKEIRKELKNERELQKQKEKILEVSAAKSDFFARMSHDIRTPINGVIGMAELARKEIDNPLQVQYCLEKITKASYHLLSLVNDILDISHLQNKKLEIAHKPMNIISFADGCISIISGQLLNRNLKIISEFGNFKHPYVLGDELHLRQAIINILGNAVKYTEDGGHIIFRIQELSVGTKTVTYRIEVEDNGIGMEQSFITHIWDTFTQEQNKNNTNYEGSGLGMPIAKSLIEDMGGTISVRSKLGEGSIFTVDLSFAIDDRTAEIYESKKSQNFEQLKGIKILLVEDNEMNRESARELLSFEGADVTVACDGQEAVEIFINSEINQFDAILMDVIMPVMNGLEATRIIRRANRSDAKSTPIIAITANAFEEDIRQSMAAGMNSHLIKPLEMSQVIKTLLYCIKMRSVNQAESLKIVMSQANKDSLTGVNNRSAYNKYELSIDENIKAKKPMEFGIVVCDINNLKSTNDTLGHEIGDRLIIEGCKKICNHFKHSPVFRIGGDEFVILLQDSDYKNRNNLLSLFQSEMAESIKKVTDVSVASGMSIFNEMDDTCVADVFKRADVEMYKNKKKMKKLM